jgi:TetR/AcrR family transcriptional regulator, mexJK operon transcriptional repressor
VSHTAETELYSPERERQILRGAAVVFGQDGYEGASMSRIAAEAGVSKGTLYNYFESKAELFTSWVRGVCDRELGIALGDLDPAAAPEALLRQVGHRFLDLVLGDPGVVIYRMVMGEAERFPMLARAFFDAGPGVAKAWLTDWLTERSAAGDLAVQDPAFAADQFLALLQTRLLAPRRLRLTQRPGTAEQRRVVDASVDMFLAFYRRG